MKNKQRQKGTERRAVIDRRVVNNPTNYASQRRRILDRRCGIDRRQIS